MSEFSHISLASSNLPVPIYETLSGFGRFCIIIACVSPPAVFTSSDSSLTDTSASYSPVSTDINKTLSFVSVFSKNSMTVHLLKDYSIIMILLCKEKGISLIHFFMRKMKLNLMFF